MRLARALLGALLFALPARAVAADGGYERVLAAIEDDPSFKVRLQAIRVLVKQLRATSERPSDRAIAVLTKAAAQDEEYLVRGLACFALGELKDERGRPGLVAASKDSQAFVRAQAEQALAALAPPAQAPLAHGGPKQIVVGADASELRDTLEGLYRAEARARYQVSLEGGTGLRMNGSIAEKSVTPTADGRRQVTIVVRITVATLPENHLRHVVSARASLVAGSNEAAIAAAEKTAMRAAAERAVKESLEQFASSEGN